MRVFFGQHSRALHAPLDDLDQAASGGHKPAVFMLAMILWRANNGAEVDFRAKQLLAEVADGDPTIAAFSDCWVLRPRLHTFQALWMFVWPPNNQQPGPVPGPLPRTHVHQCASPLWGLVPGWCGKTAGQDGWIDWSYFCSEKYRIQSLCEVTFRWLEADP